MNDPECPKIVEAFLRYHRVTKGQSQKTVDEYYLDLRLFLRFLIMTRNDMPNETDLNTISMQTVDFNFIKETTSAEITEFLYYLSNDRVFHPQTKHPGHGVEQAARARKLSTIKAFFKYLTGNPSGKLLSENPAADVEFPKQRRSLPKYLTLEESRELLSSVKGRNADRDFAILMVFLNCGLRISELAGLNYGDMHNDRLRVLGKGNKERFVYMGEACIEAIQIYNDTLPEEIRTAPRRPLFLSQKKNENGMDGRMSTNGIHRLVKKHITDAGLDSTQYSAHKLRHTAATLMLSQGVDVKTLQEVLGHEHLNTTQIYTHIENTELKIAAEANPLSDFRKE